MSNKHTIPMSDSDVPNTNPKIETNITEQQLDNKIYKDYTDVYHENIANGHDEVYNMKIRSERTPLIGDMCCTSSKPGITKRIRSSIVGMHVHYGTYDGK